MDFVCNTCEYLDFDEKGISICTRTCDYPEYCSLTKYALEKRKDYEIGHGPDRKEYIILGKSMYRLEKR